MKLLSKKRTGRSKVPPPPPAIAVRTLDAPASPVDTGVAASEARTSLIDLGVSCTLQDVAAVRSACLAALASKDPPHIDGSRVERVDTAGLQVLVGFTIDCMERSIHFTWTDRSTALERSIRRLGIGPLLESPGLAALPAGGAS
jgi:anti-anti-sigma regulatory factor